jgi:hypothetical protein
MHPKEMTERSGKTATNAKSDPTMAERSRRYRRHKKALLGYLVLKAGDS